MSKYTAYSDDNINNQIELVEDDDLLDEKGNLKKRGWSRQACLKYNPSKLSSFRKGYRLKEWNYYGVVTDKCYLAIAVADLGYIANVQTFFIDFQDDSQILKDDIIMTSFVLSKGWNLPNDSNTPGNHFKYKSGSFNISFDVLIDDNNNNSNNTEVIVDQASSSNLNQKQHKVINHQIKIQNKKMKLDAVLNLNLTPSRESMVVVTPIGKENFYYNRKVNLIPVLPGSTLKIDGVDYLDQQSANYKYTYGLMDWGRGIWDYNSFWLWSSAWGVTEDGRPLGLNLGAGFGNLTTHTENCINLDGTIHKLGHIDIKYNEKDTFQPWTFTCKHGRFGENPITFTPFRKKVETNNFGIIMSNFHQIMGKFTGTIKLDDGTSLNIDLFGFSEVHSARW